MAFHTGVVSGPTDFALRDSLAQYNTDAQSAKRWEKLPYAFAATLGSDLWRRAKYKARTGGKLSNQQTATRNQKPAHPPVLASFLPSFLPFFPADCSSLQQLELSSCIVRELLMGQSMLTRVCVRVVAVCCRSVRKQSALFDLHHLPGDGHNGMDRQRQHREAVWCRWQQQQQQQQSLGRSTHHVGSGGAL
jgi:hypothetical protein